MHFNNTKSDHFNIYSFVCSFFFLCCNVWTKFETKLFVFIHYIGVECHHHPDMKNIGIKLNERSSEVVWNIRCDCYQFFDKSIDLLGVDLIV